MVATITSTTASIVYYAGMEVKLNIRQGGNRVSNIYRVANLYLYYNPSVSGKVLKEVVEFNSKTNKWEGALTLLKKIPSLLDMDSIRELVEKEVKIPVMINDSFDERKIYGTNGSKNQTFISKEYIDTITVAVATQIVYPILATATNTMLQSRTTNGTLIVLGKLATSLFGKFINKTKIFIDTIAEKSKGKRANRVIKLKDVPEDDLPEYILGTIILIRMPTIRYEEDDHNLRPSNAWPINNFKRSIENIMKTGTMGNSSVNDRTPPLDQDGANKLSVLDDSVADSLVATDHIIAAEYYIDMDMLHQHLNIPKSIYYDDLVNTFTINTVDPFEFSYDIIKLVLFDVFPYGYIEHMDIDHLAVLQAVVVDWLTYHKLPYLAYMVCSRHGTAPHDLGAYRSVPDNNYIHGDVNVYIKDIIQTISHSPRCIFDRTDMFISIGYRGKTTKARLAVELELLLGIMK